MMNEQCEYVQHFKTALNACSLETLPPVSWGDNKRIWPLMLGCYELDELTGKRNGRLDFYAAPVPSNGANFEGIGSPRNVFGSSDQLSGVLDGKWFHRRLDDESLVYATAHSSGEIIVHKVDREQTALIGRTDSRDSGLCLSLAWDMNGESSAIKSRIISSYSDGKVAIHDINISRDEIEFDQTHFWDAHKMFRSPAEVWCASFTSNPNVVMSGGDEGSLKIWDLRAGFVSTMHTLKDFSAGATVISPHPRVDHVVACGSYDETVCLYDLRAVTDSKPSPSCHSESVGGGLWRMKWHPDDNNRLLLGAMHGGCRVIQLDDLSSKSIQFEIKQKFTNHESMAYGADWIVDRTVQVDVAASCSFYDRAFYAWEVTG